jgi:hydrogenase maturation factor
LKLQLGKVPPFILKKYVLSRIGAKREDIILGPSHGEDAAIIRVADQLLAVATDPVSGAVERIGWLSVHVATNDIATRGVRPNWFLSCIMLPENSEEEILDIISQQIDEAARLLGVGVIGGHTEVTPSLKHPLIMGTAIGVIEDGRYVTCSNAKPEGKIILTKGAGIEGTAILATDRASHLTKFGDSFIEKAQSYFNKISVVDDALIAFNYGGVYSMHDPTEGGIAGGLHELADASNLGFKVYEDKIAINYETSQICRFFNINPLNLISSGSLLIVADNTKTKGILKELNERGIRASIIGEMSKNVEKRVIFRKDGCEEDLPRPITDDLWKALSK